MTGLRERKKQQTYDALSQAAIALFLEHGFDEVSVADIAAAVDVSKPTLFKYFATKQDLVLHRIADHQHEAARVVTAAEGSPIDALHRHFLAGLERRDPVTGLNDVPQVLAYHRLVFTTPALSTRMHEFMDEDERALAKALGGDATGEVTAAQVVAVQRVLARRNWSAIDAGSSATDRYPEAVAEADAAFARLTTRVVP
ncbi:TetR family transcriptional regulator [Kribbella pittospori]|uniref:TetR family transcriptional regulator n=1 Tax=Kribbella pittospori TaxID=722689 RepID=A0A4V2MBF6_9ACTN|nr:TetR/AcrR family transcriptional regulator [Kribbella pittospori]TCC63012.1 TetR family transcriptional regulator [Kribbella pittospori]